MGPPRVHLKTLIYENYFCTRNNPSRRFILEKTRRRNHNRSPFLSCSICNRWVTSSEFWSIWYSIMLNDKFCLILFKYISIVVSIFKYSDAVFSLFYRGVKVCVVAWLNISSTTGRNLNVDFRVFSQIFPRGASSKTCELGIMVIISVRGICDIRLYSSSSSLESSNWSHIAVKYGNQSNHIRDMAHTQKLFNNIGHFQNWHSQIRLRIFSTIIF